MNPLQVREKFVLKLGAVDRIYTSGKSLKVYCKNVEQKFNLLRSNKLDVNITCNEPITGFRTGATRSLNKFEELSVVSLSIPLRKKYVRILRYLK